jgi:hypothetical protein
LSVVWHHAVCPVWGRWTRTGPRGKWLDPRGRKYRMPDTKRAYWYGP